MSSQEAVLAARIRAARKSREWSHKDLAAAAGVAEGTVARVERGEKVRPGNLYSIRVTLGIEDDVADESGLPDEVQAALDITRKYLLNSKDVQAAANELTRWVISRL